MPETIVTTPGKPRIGVALGGGAARGWAHIGVLQQLAQMGIRPDVIAGCSIGSIVGAAYAANNLDKLEKWAVSLGKLEMVRYFELKTSFNGFAHQQKLREFFHEHVCAQQQSIGGLQKKFAAVAADLHSGEEIWLREGKVIDAVWASIALPGLFPAVAYEGRWLVDGGLVNPVPVSLCRALGADIVIAVNLNNTKPAPATTQEKLTSVESTHPKTPSQAEPTAEKTPPAEWNHDDSLLNNVTGVLREYSNNLFTEKEKNPAPGLMETLAGSINITQNRITRCRLMDDPPEVLLSPHVGDLSLLEFYRAEEATQEGRNCVLRMRAELEQVTRTA